MDFIIRAHVTGRDFASIINQAGDKDKVRLDTEVWELICNK